MPTGIYKRRKETIEKMRKTHKERGTGKWMLGRKMPEETKEKISDALLAEKNPAWSKDRSSIELDAKRYSTVSNSFPVWRNNVKKRDNYRCKINNKDCSGGLEVHHILKWIDYPELRFDLNNGITLCHAHHPKGKLEKELISHFQDLIRVEI